MLYMKQVPFLHSKKSWKFILELFAIIIEMLWININLLTVKTITFIQLKSNIQFVKMYAIYLINWW